ncbi:hypothetical protein TWF506_001917 [Arthrobotrys conoides]|uniref:Uncharacterized protein n=1 Tax=Arthrobotrys conoides TaxID=74498 RepID=A0AAN8NNN4_9PEZI
MSPVATSSKQAPGNSNPVIPTSDDPAALFDIPSNEEAKPTLFRRITDKVIVPVVALGLATPIISQGICLVGSKILKHRMERETEAMMSRARAGDGQHSGRGDPIALSQEEEEMRRAEMAAIKEHLKRRKEDAKVQRQLLKAEKAAMRKSESTLAQKLKKESSRSATTTATATTPITTINKAKNRAIDIDTSEPPTYSEAIGRVDNLVHEWEQASPSTLPFHKQTTSITYDPATDIPARDKSKSIIGWVQGKKAAAYQGLKLDQKKAASKSKVKVTKKAGLIFGFGYWGNY